MKKQVVVIGLGRFGSSVAKALYHLGHDVLAIDSDEQRVQSMMGQVTYSVTGDATNESVLTELGVSDYDAAVVAISSNIVSNVMSCVLLKTMGIPFIAARAQNELHANTLERIGVDKVIQAETEMGIRLARNLFNPNVQEYMELLPGFGISKVLLPDHFANKTLKELGYKGPLEKKEAAVLALLRGSDLTLNPDIERKLRAGDVLVFAGKDEMLVNLLRASGR